MHVLRSKFCNALTVSSGNNKYSEAVSVGQATHLGIHLDWTVVSSGTVTTTLWVSCKEKPSAADDTDWVQLSDATVSGPAGSSSKSFTPLENICARWFRLKFAYASGTSATINGWIQAKS